MRIVTAEEMRKLDRFAMETIGIPAAVLMESAGRSVFAEIRRREGDFRGAPSVVVCGGGNNGGDGFVVARYLRLAGSVVDCFLVGSKPPSTEEARANLIALERMGQTVTRIGSAGDLATALKGKKRWKVVVDALFGIGLERAVTGVHADVIEWINSLPSRKYSVDLPSGLHTDTGVKMGCVVHADTTVTLAAKKRAFFLNDGLDCAGDICVADISIDPDWGRELSLTPVYETDPSEAMKLLPPRKKGGHKGTYGHLLVIGGSAERSGAVVLAARAALRAGAGLVTAAVPKSAHTVIKRQLVEVMTELIDDRNGEIHDEALVKMTRVAKGKNAFVLGPGLKNHAKLRSALLSFLEGTEAPFVLDADALNAFGLELRNHSKMLSRAIVTPHPGEMARLTGRSTNDIQRDRIEVARSFAADSGAVVVLKGAYTVIAEPNGLTHINPTGNPGMATAGTGDVLSGMIGAYLAQGLTREAAAVKGVFDHGRAGDSVLSRRPARGMVAGDLIEALLYSRPSE